MAVPKYSVRREVAFISVAGVAIVGELRE